MLIDTHCHLYHNSFASDLDDVVQRARNAGVDVFLQPAIDIPSIREALSLCDRYEGLYAMAALHPTETNNATDRDLTEIEAFCDDPRVVAVGETGLDYFWDQSYIAKQQDVLRFHARLAVEKDLPLVLHNRDQQGREESSDDLIRILTEEQATAPAGKRLFGVFHCFGGSREFARAVMDLGFHVGIGGTLTFKNGGVPEAIADIPLGRIVLETDAPYLAPVPHRGKRNEPGYVLLVAEKLAELRQMPTKDLATITTANARLLFKLNAASSTRSTTQTEG